jgi:hypothetical protein
MKTPEEFYREFYPDVNELSVMDNDIYYNSSLSSLL